LYFNCHSYYSYPKVYVQDVGQSGNANINDYEVFQVVEM